MGLNKNQIIAILFFTLTIFFVAITMTNKIFFDWVFNRHHNQWSWYIRPLFLVPFCYFSYKQNWSGITITIFCLFTSMFWFPSPELVSDNVKEFLQFEKDFLYGEWDMKKVMMILTIPISFIALGFSFWKRSLIMGIGVLILMATGKMVWSIYNAGESGKSILVPAIIGLIICCGLIYYGSKRLEKKLNFMKLLINMFWNKEEQRLRAVFRFLIEFSSYFLITNLLAKVVRLFIDYPTEFNGATPLWVIFILILFRFARLITVWISAKYMDKRLFSDLGVTLNKTWWIELLFGLGLGAIAMSSVFAVQLSLGWVSIKEVCHVFSSDGSFVISLITYFIFILVAAAVEEFFYRGYLLQNIAEGLNFKNNPNKAIIFAVLLSSILFGLTHVFNDGATFVSTANIMFAGVFLSIGYILTGRLAISIGLHIAWNFFQGNIFGFAISGNTFIKESVTLFSIEQRGSDVWTGGDFGPEAGFIGLIAMLIITFSVIIWVYVREGQIKLYSPIAIPPSKKSRGKYLK